MANKTWQEFVQLYNGKSVDDDNAYSYQCVDCMRLWYKYLTGSNTAYPTGTGWADGYWYNRYKQELSYKNFDFIDPADLQCGDICFWKQGSSSETACPSSHVALKVGDNKYFSENQQTTFKGFCTVTISPLGLLGGFRWKGWSTKVNIEEGYHDLNIGSHEYKLYRQRSGQNVGVLSAGLNKVATIDKLDADGIIVMARCGNSNYFQMKNDQSDALNTTYGDISSPLCSVYQNLCQDAVLYYNLDTGKYGATSDSDKAFRRNENIYSPAMVYHDNTFEYAPMVGISHATLSAYYPWCMHTTANDYIIGICCDKATPNEINADLKTVDGYKDLAILDGGGSSKLMHGYTIESQTTEQRAIASCIAFYKFADEDTTDCDDCKIDTSETVSEETAEEEKDGDGGTLILSKIDAILGLIEAHAKTISALSKEVDELTASVTELRKENASNDDQ